MNATLQSILDQIRSSTQTAFTESSTWIVLLDIALVYYLIYRGLLLLKGTKAVRMLLGLMLIIVFYFFAKQFHLHTFTWILDQFFSSFIVVVLILFQDDIRRALSRVGINPFGSKGRLAQEDRKWLEELVKSVGTLSTKKIGALIVLERDADLLDHIQEGTEIDAVLSEELLFSLFLPYSPIHDGAVVIHLGRVVRAGCFLPLTRNPAISKHLGTRHRAAIGLTESTDAIVLVVSETDGKISLCLDGTITRGLDPAAVFNRLLALLEPHAFQRGEIEPLTPTKEKRQGKPLSKNTNPFSKKGNSESGSRSLRTTSSSKAFSEKQTGSYKAIGAEKSSGKSGERNTSKTIRGGKTSGTWKAVKSSGRKDGNQDKKEASENKKQASPLVEATTTDKVDGKQTSAIETKSNPNQAPASPKDRASDTKGKEASPTPTKESPTDKE